MNYKEKAFEWWQRGRPIASWTTDRTARSTDGQDRTYTSNIYNACITHTFTSLKEQDLPVFFINASNQQHCSPDTDAELLKLRAWVFNPLSINSWFYWESFCWQQPKGCEATDRHRCDGVRVWTLLLQYCLRKLKNRYISIKYIGTFEILGGRRLTRNRVLSTVQIFIYYIESISLSRATEAVQSGFQSGLAYLYQFQLSI